MIFYCVEDALSRSVAEKLIDVYCPQGIVTSELGGVFGGYGAIKRKFSNYYDLSRRSYVFIITDLDRAECAPSLRTDWLVSAGISEPLPERMLFCIAQREIESWLMADTTGISKLLHISAARINNDVENAIIDAKEYLVHLARSSGSAAIRSGLLPARGSAASTGLNYNHILMDFVRSEWNPEAASENSISLRRAINKLSQVEA